MKLYDHYIIHVDNIWEETVVHGLQVMNGLRWIDQERDRYTRKRRWGIVVSEPAGLTGSNHTFIDPGWPNPRIHVGHDLIQEKINMGFPEYHDWERFYNLATHEEIMYDTLADYPTDARVGEKVYFHPSVTEPENKIGPNLYKCRADLLVCVMPDFRMQGGYILVKPIERSNEDHGLILSTSSERELLRGILDGQEVLFQDYADWEYEIEGEKYYAMRRNEILTV